MKLKLALVGIILIFLALSVRADTLEGNFYGSAAQCQTIQRDFSLCNTSAVQQTYSVYAFGEKSSWATLSPASIFLNAGQCGKIYAFITPSCYAVPGSYEIGIEAKSSLNTISKTFFLTVTEGHVISLDVSPEHAETTQCKEKSFKVRAENTGRFDERVQMSISGIPSEWAEFGLEDFVLAKNEAKEFFLYITPPCNQELKTYSFTVNAKLVLSSTTIQKNAEIEIKNGQAVEIGLEQNINACREESISKQITVKNNGLLKEKLLAVLAAPSWVKVDKSELELEAGETKTLLLSIEKNSEAEGNYDVELKLHSVNFGLDYSKKAVVSLKDCYNLKIEKVSGETSNCREEKFYYKFLLTNNGTKEIQAKIAIAGITNSLNKNTATIKAGEKQEIEAVFSPFDLAEGKKSFLLSIDSQYFSESRQFEVEISDCYGLEVKAEALSLCKCISGNAEANIFNTGSMEQTFRIESSVSWIKPSITEIKLKGKENALVPILIEAPCDAITTAYALKVYSDKNSLTEEKSISYGSSSACFETKLLDLKKQIDVNADDTKLVNLRVKNSGITTQKISVALDAPSWVLISPNEINLAKGEEAALYLYLSPPIDAESEAKIKIILSTEYGFKKEYETQITVFGAGVGISVKAGDISIEEVEIKDIKETKQKQIDLTLEVSNNTDSAMKIMDINAGDYNAMFEIRNAVIQKKGEGEIKMSLFVAADANLESLTIPLNILTDKGVYSKSISLKELVGELEKEKTTQPKAVGFAGLYVSQQNAIIVLIIIVLLLIAYIAVKYRKPIEAEKCDLSMPEEKWGTAETAKEARGKPKAKKGKRK